MTPKYARICHVETFTVKVEPSGRILIPALLRRQLGIGPGNNEIILRVDENGVSLSTRSQALGRVRRELRKYIPEGSDLSAELIAERRREAAKE